MKAKFTILATILLLGACNYAPTIPISSKPKIMSVNACADQLAISLADEDQIISLSNYSKDKISSAFADIAIKYPSNYGTAEELLKYKPNIVLMGGFEGDATIKTAQLMNMEISKFGVPHSLNQAKDMVSQMGATIGQRARATELINQINLATEISTLPKVKALVYFSGGNSAGKNTLLDEVLERSGFINMAPYYGIDNWGPLDLERLVANPPQILIIADKNTNGAFAEKALRHPVLKAKSLKMKIAHFPNQFAYCGGEVIPKLAQHLKKIREDYEK